MNATRAHASKPSEVVTLEDLEDTDLYERRGLQTLRGRHLRGLRGYGTAKRISPRHDFQPTHFGGGASKDRE